MEANCDPRGLSREQSSQDNVSSVTRDRASIEELADLVREVYQSHLLRGYKFEEAREQAAADMGIKPRVVRMFLEGEVFAVPADRAAAITAGHLAALCSLHDWHTNRAAMITRRLITLGVTR
jgi:hypothetical protein